jgi:hypothetical protein
MEYIIIILLLWIIIWQFLFTATVCDNQALILKKIDELYKKLDKL